MNKVLFITNLIMGSILSRFAISKLAAWSISVEAFIEMAQPLGIDPTFFRMATGILIAIVVMGYWTTAIFTLIQTNNGVRSAISFIKIATYSNLLGSLTMAGALIAEFSLRVQPKWLLVYIAVGIILISATNLFILYKQKPEYL